MNQSPLPSPEQRYHLDSPRFNVEFEYYWSQLATGMELFTSQAKLEELHDKAFAKEQSFFTKVYESVSDTMETASGPVVCLFDIDGTIAEMKDEATSDIHMLLRPAFPVLIVELATKHPEILRFGLLSLRPIASLQEEAENPTFLSPARPFIDDTLMYSSEVVTRQDPLMDSSPSPAVVGDFLRSMRGIIDPLLLAETAKGTINLFEWYDPKLKVVQQLLHDNPDVTYVLVDNLPCAALFDSANRRLSGICVQAEEQLLIPCFDY
ncbi:MAG: hypothetical protein QFB87_00600 [Patescibacteria group bacterium]|nr:hypothetical protein [Patescibacteria group bacterium]